MPRLEHPNTTGSVTSLSANTGIVTTTLGLLDTISLTTDGAVVIGNGSGPVVESGATLRTSLGVGIGNSPLFNALSLTTPLPVTSGGTGGATAAAGRAGLELSVNDSPSFTGLTVNDGSASTNDVLFKVQDSGSSVFTVDKEGDVVVSGGLTVQGTATYIESTTIQVEDRNLELGTVETPTDLTADGGGIILKGPTNSDKTILWESDTDTWNFNQGIKVTTGDTSLNLIDQNGNYIVNSQTVNDLQSDASFHFTTVANNDHIKVDDDVDNRDIFDDGGTIEAWIYADSSDGIPSRIITKDGSASVGWLLGGYGTATDAFYFDFIQEFGTTIGRWNTPETISLNEWHHLLVTYDNSSVSNNPILYVDGVSQTVTESSTPVGTRVSDSGYDIYIGNRQALARSWNGQISQVRIHNRALSAAEVRAAYNGQAVGFEYRGASQTELLTDGGLEAWTGDALDSWTEVETGSSTITNDQANERSGSNSAKFTLDSSGSVMMMKQNVSFVEGKRYRLSLWAKGATGSGEGFYIRTDATGGTYGGDTGTLGGGGATASWQQNTINNSISGSWTEHAWEFVAASTDNAFVLIRSGDDSTSFYVDDLSVKRLGCVAEYLPSGITKNDTDGAGGIWYDSSGNGLNGATSTATPVNFGLPALTIDAQGVALNESLLTVKQGGTTKFSVDENGNVDLSGNLATGGWYQGASDKNLLFSDDSLGAFVQSPTNTDGAAGTIHFRNASGTVKMAINTNSGNVTPGGDNAQDLGSSSLRWANLHVADMQLSNLDTGGNDVDGTEGSWSVQEGEDDIFLINRKNGKRFKIKLEEVE